MKTIYIEVVESSYMRGTSTRSIKNTSFVPVEVEDLSDDIITVLEKYASENDVLLGQEYNNAMVGTDYHNKQKHCTAIYIPRDEIYYSRVLVEYRLYLGIRLDHFVWSNQKYEYLTDPVSHSIVDFHAC